MRVHLHIFFVILILIILDNHVVEVGRKVVEDEFAFVVRPNLSDNNAPRLQGDCDAVWREAPSGNRDLARYGTVFDLRDRERSYPCQKGDTENPLAQVGMSAGA